MRAICLSVTLILGLALSAEASSLPVLELEPGTNQISILVVNQRKTALDSVDVAVNSDLPGWLKITGTTPVDVPAGAEQKLGLNLHVGEVPPGSSGELPLVLRDNAGHSWHFQALLKVVPTNKYELSPNFPNPFNPATTIRYALARKEPTQTELSVFNILGQKVRTLVSKPQSAGVYSVVWDGRDDSGHKLASGVYFYRIVSGHFVRTRRMLLLQ